MNEETSHTGLDHQTHSLIRLSNGIVYVPDALLFKFSPFSRNSTRV